MKANEAPEKIYISANSKDGTYYISNQYKRLIEYTRTDAFMDKAAEWIKNKAERYIVDSPLCSYFDYKRAIEDFKEYMKEE